MRFADVVGHEELKDQLRKSVLLDRIAHTQLFRGGRGCGHLALALAYTRYMLCQDRNAKEACGVCTSCLSLDKLEHPDVHLSFPTRSEKDKHKKECDHFVGEFRTFVLEDPYADRLSWVNHHSPNKNLEIRVNEAAAIARKISLRSYMGTQKVVIIWCAEDLNREAANKLLKSIEEPPEKTIFMLLSTEADRLLPTIISRTQQHFLPPVDPESIVSHLTQNFELDQQQATSIATRSEGDVFEARTIAIDDDQELLPLFREWMLSCYFGKVNDTTDASVAFQGMGREGQKRFIRYGIQKIRQCMLYAQGLDDLVHASAEEKEFLQKFKGFVSLDTAEWFREEFERMHYELDRNANAKIMFMDTSYQLYGRLKS